MTVVRRVRPEAEGLFLGWAERMVDAVRVFPGCLGAALLSAVAPGEFHMVFRFIDGEALRAWERSEERSGLLAEVDAVVVEERVTTVAGDEEFLTSLASTRARRPLPLRVLVDVLWIFPVAFFWSSTLAPWFVGLPLPVATLLSAAVITSLAEFLLVPVRRRIRVRRGLPLGRVVRS